MEFENGEWFRRWLTLNDITFSQEFTGVIKFSSELVFRVPIDEQPPELIDHAIRSAVGCIGKQHGVIIHKRNERWTFDSDSFSSPAVDLLQSVIRLVGFPEDDCVLVFSQAEYDLAAAIIRLVNLWGRDPLDGINVVQRHNPQLLMYCATNFGSLFIDSKSREDHDEAVCNMQKAGVRVWGPHVRWTNS